jgi:hypothetical protein
MGKVYGALVIETCTRWLEDATPERRALIEHALRTAVKRKDAGALRLLGFGQKAQVAVEEVGFAPQRVTIGGRVAISFVLRNKSKKPQDVLVDLCVHFVKANGKTAPEVFKLTRATLPPRGAIALRTSVSVAVLSTRTPHTGTHAVDAVVNGVAIRLGSFEVTRARR